MSELQAWLDKLGALSADEIRKLMQEEGIRGIPGTTTRCPVARFLQVKLNVDYAHVGFGEVAAGHRFNCAPIPYSVTAFVYRFDALAYPELICNE